MSCCCCNVLSTSASGCDFDRQTSKEWQASEFCYLIEDPKDIKPDVEVIKIMTEDSKDTESSCMFLHFMLHQLPPEANELKDKIKWICDQIVHSTNQILFPRPNIMGNDITIHHTCH